MGQGRQCQPQHAGAVALIEQVVLPQLERHQVAREGACLFFVQRDGPCQVSLDPGCHCRHEPLLAFGGGGGVAERQRDERPCMDRPVGGLGKHVQCGTGGLHDGTVVAVADLQDIGDPCLAGNEAFDEVVQRTQAGRIGKTDRVAQAVGQHV